MKHTAGDWYTNEKGEIIGIQDSNHTVIAQTFNTRHNDPSGQTQKANAKLMASSPKLLKALQDLLKEFDSYDEHMAKIGRGHEDYGKQRENARMAIAQAIQ